MDSGLLNKLKNGVGEFIDDVFTRSDFLAKAKNAFSAMKGKSVKEIAKSVKNGIFNGITQGAKDFKNKFTKESLKQGIRDVTVILKIVMFITDFAKGYDQAEAVLEAVDLSPIEKFAAGLAYALCNLSLLFSFFYKTVASCICWILGRDLEDRKKKADEEYKKYVAESGSTMSKDQFLRKSYSYSGAVEVAV